jgi:hypothetical protein
MRLNADFLRRCINVLEAEFDEISKYEPGDFHYDAFRAASIKHFELILEQSGGLLRKRLRAWFASNRQVDRLNFRDVFRYAAKHDLISADACERWLKYRDNRNDTAHNYGEDFAESTLALLPTFIKDARVLAAVIERADDD